MAAQRFGGGGCELRVAIDYMLKFSKKRISIRIFEILNDPAVPVRKDRHGKQNRSGCDWQRGIRAT